MDQKEFNQKMSQRLQKTGSICVTVGTEGKVIEKNCFEGESIGVFTSGGDSQGMCCF